ncbi:hypothetical protein O6H91_21G047000 [Diphasiastrum complanatum]|uniref:Uncharacterized protein n=1 Tax=Diphasiastrum complanatum TaxID=34168 RepID=A0ACC2AK50_DIPCM|nr:hypothetical protein O6H91_21G047000 [Diphasiastrum complanatum]
MTHSRHSRAICTVYTAFFIALTACPKCLAFTVTSFSLMVSSLTIDVASFSSWLDLKPVDEHVSMHWFTLWIFLFETFLSFYLSVVCEFFQTHLHHAFGLVKKR